MKEIPRHGMDSPRSQWEPVRKPPWIARLTGGRSPASSGAESDTEGSSTESEKSRSRHSDSGSMKVATSPSMLQQRITEIDQQREELKIELQLEIALLQGELQTERALLCRDTQQLQALQEHGTQRGTGRRASRQKEHVRLEEERERVEELKRRCEEQERLIPSQPESQREQLLLQLQQEKEAAEAAARAFEDWEFRVLEQESGIDSEPVEGEKESKSKGEMERDVYRQQHAVSNTQERVQQLEKQLREMEREKDRQMNALRQERRELLHACQRILKEKKPLSNWANIPGSTPCMMSMSPLTNHKVAQESSKDTASLPRRRTTHRGKVSDRPLSTQGIVRMHHDGLSPEMMTPPRPLSSSSHRHSNGHANGHWNTYGYGNGFLTPCNSANSSRAPSPSLLDLVEIERKLREAKAERERLLKEREEWRQQATDDRQQKELESLSTEGEQAKSEVTAETDAEELPLSTPLPNSPEGVPLSFSPNFDLRAHVESLGHGVASCLGVRLLPRRCGGFLTKRGGRVKTWRRRWFLFDLDHRRLAYYTDQDEKKLKGVIYFQAIEEVYYDHLRTATTSPRPSLTFCVKTYERLFYLVAPSPEAMRIWMDVIVTATDEHCRY
ncbi:pleckstrin homology-like domain family B member 3 isoform X2 [Clupea harengus]|uniref:Pleckstrin homology-like domain family B member 3 isoform X2 n=1 Tax=Clupea harengus TaxID=7950 RepID=A0A6P8GB55_CLUHA|nr:pleckstrin homology-like domain family B member 3 isoform X2 [Clupea harengus]